MSKYSRFSPGDRVRLTHNPKGYSELPLGGTGTVKKVDDYPDGGFLLVDWDADCGLDDRDQNDYWIETRFDFAEDDHIEAPTSIGGLFE